MNIKAIVTDIEGTTTSISFVSDVLFPYAAAKIEAFLIAQQNDEAIKAIIDRIQTQYQLADLSAVITQCQQWIKEDQKVTELKELQGYIWQAGYQSGELQGHTYDDVKPFLAKWKQQGKVLAVYSSGSVKAQKLLFGYADVGDLTSLFSHYFDTHIGHKREAAAYQHISQQLKIPADEILFLSDIHQELAAAKQAGLQVIGLNRDTELNAEQHPSEYTWLSSFKEVDSVLQK